MFKFITVADAVSTVTAQTGRTIRPRLPVHTARLRVNCDIPGDTGVGVRKEGTNRLLEGNLRYRRVGLLGFWLMRGDRNPIRQPSGIFRRCW